MNASELAPPDQTDAASPRPSQLLTLEALQGPLESAQFVSLAFGKTCIENGIAKSMGSRGDCFDNAVAETFFATLTKEKLLHDLPPGGWPTRAGLRTAIFTYIEGWYNRRRLHSTLGMHSPAEYEADHAARLNELGDDDPRPASWAAGRACPARRSTETQQRPGPWRRRR